MHMKTPKIKTLFLDIGGVLLTNGWDHKSREKAAKHFKLDSEEMNERHHLTFDTYESGKLSLDEYLNRVVFYEKRTFSKEKFKTFMFNESKPLDNAIDFFKTLKKKFNLRVVALSNEGREINDYRIKKYMLDELFDGFVSSCFVHLRKPDIDIYKLACDVSNTKPGNALCIDDRLMFIQVAQSHGIRTYHFQDLASAKKQLVKILA